MVNCLNNLTIETAGTEEEAEEGLAVALEMEVQGEMLPRALAKLVTRAAGGTGKDGVR